MKWLIRIYINGMLTEEFTSAGSLHNAKNIAQAKANRLAGTIDICVEPVSVS